MLIGSLIGGLVFFFATLWNKRWSPIKGGLQTAVQTVEPLLLREMLRNLVDNSIAYAGQGAEATVRVGGGDAPWLEVTDTGAGVSPGLLAGLGSRFSRGDAGKPGAGLGLSIVREIASLFGAAVTISAPEGQGFSVRVAFPQRVDAAPGERVSA